MKVQAGKMPFDKHQFRPHPRERLGFQEATDVKTLCNLGIKESLRFESFYSLFHIHDNY